MIANPGIPELVYEYFIQKAPVLFLVLSMEGDIIEANQYAYTITGNHLIENNIKDLLVDFDGSFNLSNVINDSTKEHLLNISTSSGLPQTCFFSFKRCTNQILAFGRLDVEEIANIQKEVFCLNQELNNLMRQIHRKNAQLKRLNEEKNRFLGMAAHDLRKPIGLIITYSEFLLEEAAYALDTEHIDFLNTINASSSFMKRLVDDFLDVSTIEAGKFELDLQPASIYDILKQSLKLNNLQAIKKMIELKEECKEGIPYVVIDASKLEQAITNLISNAIEHSNSTDQVVIRLSYDEQSIIFSVQDSGPGIAPEEIDKIFKPFEKTSTKKTGGEKSTGLGMMITRKVIEAHGGSIWVESQLGKGTTVSFNIPTNKSIG